MPASVIGKSLNLGYPGNVSRNDPRTFIMPRAVKTAAIPFGYPVELNSDNSYDLFAYDSAADVFAGVSLRNVKQQTIYASNSLGQYEVNQSCDVLQQGFLTVGVNPSASLTAGGAVYAVFDSTHKFKYFDIVAPTSPSTDTGVLLPNCKWATGAKDGNYVAELEMVSAAISITNNITEGGS
jgi:hypothetical protein